MRISRLSSISLSELKIRSEIFRTTMWSRPRTIEYFTLKLKVTDNLVILSTKMTYQVLNFYCRSANSQDEKSINFEKSRGNLIISSKVDNWKHFRLTKKWLKLAKTPDMTQPITLAVVWYFVCDLIFSTNQSCCCIQLTLQWRVNHINLLLRSLKRSNNSYSRALLINIFLYIIQNKYSYWSPLRVYQFKIIKDI